MYTLLIIYGLLSIFISFLCSILEASLLSVTHAFINIKKQEGFKYADQLEKLKDDIDRPLIAILTINTIANTAGALLVGVEAEHVFGSGNNIVFAISFIMTFLILLVSEIIPKTIGATYWKELAKFMTKTLSVYIFIMKYTGLLWLLLFTTRLIGKEEVHGSSVFSREDFHAMTEIAEEEGVFEEQESTVIKNIISFKETTVNEIMTPRSVMLTANEGQKIIDFYNENKELRFSRIPLYKEDHPDDITGYFLKDKLYDAIIKGLGEKELKSIKRDIIITNRDTSVADLFEKLIEHKEHIALVYDEYGSVSGLVTQEDAIETLLGLEIMDESDRHEDMQKLAKTQHKKREDEHNQEE